MARRPHNELVAGIFVLAALAVLIGVIVWLGGADMLSPPRQKAFFFAREGDGSFNLQKGSFVQVGDDQVGKIVKVRFDANQGRTFYTAEIDRKDVKVYADGKVRVAAGLIGGSRLVIINRGSDAAPLADEEHAVELAGGLDKAMGNLEDATAKVSLIADAVMKELNSQDSSALLAKVHGVVESLRTAAGDVADIAANVKAETDAKNNAALVAKLHTSMDDINVMTADAKPKVGKTLSALQDTAESIRAYSQDDLAELLLTIRQAGTQILKISRDFSDVSGQVREVVMLNRDNIDEILDNMTQVSANLKATSKEVRRSPWRLMYTPTGKEVDSQNIYDAAMAFSSGAEQLDQAISKLNGLAKASPEGLPADDPDVQKVREQLQDTFGKFQKAEQALWKELGQ